MRWMISAGALLTSAGCGDSSPERTATAELAETSAAVAKPAVSHTASSVAPQIAGRIALDGQGLRLVDASSGATRLVEFGASRKHAEALAEAALGGIRKRTELGECGAGPMQFSAYPGLTLNFQNDKLVGWTAEGTGDLATMDGIGPGVGRSVVEDARQVAMVADSTLGAEFTLGPSALGAIGGFFNGKGSGTKVQSLHAGTTCFFR